MSLAPELVPVGYEDDRRTYRWVITVTRYRFIQAKGIRTSRHAEHVALRWVDRWAARHGETILDIRYGYERMAPFDETGSLRILASVRGVGEFPT